VVTKLGGRYNLGQVREALEFLSNEGHVYSTIDDQHYKTCT
jgi:replication factor A2